MTFKNSLLLLLLLQDPDLVPAIGQFEGAVVPGHVERLVHVWDAVSLQALQKFHKLLTLHVFVGETTMCPERRQIQSLDLLFFCLCIDHHLDDLDTLKYYQLELKSTESHNMLMCKFSVPDISCKLFPLFHKHVGVTGLWWTGLMLLWDVEGHSELRLTCRAISRLHAARHRGRHLHFDL